MVLISGYVVTSHALMRIQSRGLSMKDLNAAIIYGRQVFTRGVRIFALGTREMKLYSRWGVDLKASGGVQVVCSTDSNVVVTAYRNRNFHGLRDSTRRRGRRKT